MFPFNNGKTTPSKYNEKSADDNEIMAHYLHISTDETLRVQVGMSTVIFFFLLNQIYCQCSFRIKLGRCSMESADYTFSEIELLSVQGILETSLAQEHATLQNVNSEDSSYTS